MKKIIQKHMQKQGIFQDRQDPTAIASSEVNESNAAIVEEDKEWKRLWNRQPMDFIGFVK